jgi:hypothetical protein
MRAEAFRKVLSDFLRAYQKYGQEYFKVVFGDANFLKALTIPSSPPLW